MKKFFINGEVANLSNLNLEALSKNGSIVDSIVIPADRTLKVTLADKSDPLCPDIDAVSEATSRYAYRHGKKRHFLLFNGGRVVGWAHLHRKPTEHKVRVGVLVEYETTVLAKSNREAERVATQEAENSLHIFTDAGYNAEIKYATAE
jgi:hypothetical protein